MERKKMNYRHIGITVFALGLGLCAAAAGAQTAPNGQMPGARSHRSTPPGCTSPDTAPGTTNGTDPNCVEGTPGFASPAMDVPPADAPHVVTAIIRVDTAMPRPPVVLPAGNSFTVLGNATLIKVRRADQDACLNTGKRISARVSAATSTTCLDRKGDLLAVQECKSGAADCSVMTAQEIASQQMTAPKP